MLMHVRRVCVLMNKGARSGEGCFLEKFAWFENLMEDCREQMMKWEKNPDSQRHKDMHMPRDAI